MNEGAVEVEPSFMPHHQAAEIEQPGDGAFDDPAVAIAAQLAIVLPPLPPVATMRHDQVDAAPLEPLPKGAGVVAAVRHEALGLHARATGPTAGDRDLGEDALREADLGHRGSFQANSERKTRALDQYHELRALTLACLADAGSPFFAGAKVPSTKHSSQPMSPC